MGGVKVSGRRVAAMLAPDALSRRAGGKSADLRVVGAARVGGADGVGTGDTGRTGDAADSGTPRYVALADGLRLLIGDGRLLAGTSLPSERELSAALGVSRTTATHAYDLLRQEGSIASRRGSGTVVLGPRVRTLAGATAPLGSAGLDAGGRGDLARDVLDLTCAASAGQPELLPWYAAALERLPAYVSDSGYHPLGLPVLREALARRFTERGVPTGPEQIIVTTGALAGLSVVARAYVGSGDRVLFENPSYPGGMAAMRHAGARLVGIPAEGDLAASAATVIRQTSPTMAVLIPDFANPSGRLLRTSERRELGAVLRAGGVRAVVDETLVETAFDAQAPMPLPFAACARAAIMVGSASKSHWGGMRIGWIRAPRDDVPRLAAARLGLDIGAPILEQLVLAGMLGEGLAALPGERAAHRLRCAALVTAVRTHLPDWEFEEPGGGLSLWCRLPEPLSSAIVTRCEERGTLLVPGAAFSVDGAGLERFLRLPFALEPPQLGRAVEDIAAAVAAGPGRSRQRSAVTVVA